MQKLRSTFKRSKTPSASDVKLQNSLDIPKQVRSVSFDELQFMISSRKDDCNSKASKSHQSNCSTSSDLSSDCFNNFDNNDQSSRDFLSLPLSKDNQRSKSVDSAISEDNVVLLEVPRRIIAKKKSLSINNSFLSNCVHCQYLDELQRSLHSSNEDLYSNESLCFSEDTSSSEYDDDSRYLNPNDLACDNSSVKIFLSPHSLEYYDKHTLEHLPIEKLPSPIRRKSICRQEALLLEPKAAWTDDKEIDVLSGNASPESVLSEGNTTTIHGTIVRDFYLTVPDLKRDRAVSVDSSFSKVSSSNKTEQYFGSNLEVPVSSRSRSVDIVLPTLEHSRYKALASSNTHSSLNKQDKEKSSNDELDTLNLIKYVPDWTDNALNGDHLWTPTSMSGDFCYVNENDCVKQGPRLKCPACNIIVHQSCIPIIKERMKFLCKSTFRDVGIRQYREQTSIYHHWVHQRSEQGKCKKCGKAFQSKLSFSCKEIVAISCSWCKVSYHNKESCFTAQRIEEECNLGVQRNIIVPPSWIVKLPKRGNFKSSLRDNSKKKSSSHRKKSREKDKDFKLFAIKSIPSASITPLIVFINPKSGGNQGVKLLQKFQWLLNPRQVFDLTQGGPRMGLELFRKVPNLRVLACGGDGTVGWVLSVLDQINFSPSPAVGVLPLGTGNDLARALGWGGGYTDEPVSKILTNISNSNIVKLDRWHLRVEKNTNSTATADGKENLPLNVINNYFSMGVDAHIALEFHEAREAHPEKFNSRLRNKMFYGQAGGKDLLKRKWKGLAEFVTLECDGKDLTPKLKEHRVHAIVFLNIQSYGGGTKPWNRNSGFIEPATDDELIEVVGLTTYQLPLLQAGGHGMSLAQCKEAKIITSRTIPMQVDGEACKVNPSIIHLTFLNKASMLSKRKGAKQMAEPKLDDVTINVFCLLMNNYEKFHYDKDTLISTATEVGQIRINPIFDLEQIRCEINKLCESNQEFLKLSTSDWCFVDSCTAERFFRIDRAQEQLHCVTDISNDNLYILNTTETLSPIQDEVLLKLSNKDSSMELRIVDDNNLDSPSDHPPVSPKSQQSPDDEYSTDIENDQSRENIKNLQNVRILDPVNEEEHSLHLKSDVSKTCDSIINAAKIGDLNAIRKLHNQGYSMLYVDSHGHTALHYASECGHVNIVKFLLTFSPKSIVDMKDNNLQTSLHRAALCKQRTICCLLIAAGADLELHDIEGLTPYLLAIRSGDHELASYLQSQEHFQKLSRKSATTV